MAEMKRIHATNHHNHHNGDDNDGDTSDGEGDYDDEDGHDHDGQNGNGNDGDNNGHDSDGEGDEDEDIVDVDHVRRVAAKDRQAAAATQAELYSDRTAHDGDSIRDLWRRHASSSLAYAATQRRGCRSCLVDTFTSKADDTKYGTIPPVALLGPLYQPMIGVTLTQSLIVPTSADQRSDAAIDGKRYQPLVVRHFEHVMPTTAMRWSTLYPSDDGIMDPARIDGIVSWANKQRPLPVEVRSTPLISSTCIPKWIWTMEDEGKLTQAKLLDAMSRQINDTMARFRDDINVWEVVGDAFDDKGGYRSMHRKRDELLMKYMGAAYIEECFLVARRAIPSAVLLYHDHNCHLLSSPTTKCAKADGIYAMCQDFITRNIPIHGVAFQCHIDAAQVRKHDGGYDGYVTAFEKNIARFGQLGLRVYIDDLDVSIINLKGDSIHKFEAQAQIYHTVISMLARQSCVYGVTLGGLVDKYPRTLGDPCALLDNHWRAKVAFHAIRNGIIGAKYKEMINAPDWNGLRGPQLERGSSSTLSTSSLTSPRGSSRALTMMRSSGNLLPTPTTTTTTTTNGNTLSGPKPSFKRVETVTEAPSPYISGRHMSMDEEQPKIAQVVADAIWYDSVTKRRAPSITLKVTRHLARQGCTIDESSLVITLVERGGWVRFDVPLPPKFILPADKTPFELPFEKIELMCSCPRDKPKVVRVYLGGSVVPTQILGVVLPVHTASWTDFQYSAMGWEAPSSSSPSAASSTIARARITSAAVHPKKRTVPITIEFTDTSQCAIRSVRLTRLSEELEKKLCATD